MAKFMLVKFSLMVEITDAGVLRDAALEKFDAFDSTSADYPTALTGTHRRKARRSAARSPPRNRDALNQFVDPATACGLLDGVPGRALASRTYAEPAAVTAGIAAPLSTVQPLDAPSYSNKACWLGARM